MNGFENGNGTSSAMEKMVNNVWTILLSRLAMMLALPFAYLAMNWIDVKFEDMRKDQAQTQAQVDELARSDRVTSQTLQSHEARIEYNKTTQDSFEARSTLQFGNISNSLMEVSKTLYSVDKALEKLKSTLEERERKELGSK